MAKQAPHGGGKRLIVYVDAQLRYSKRFNPDGIYAEYPEFFAPLPRRRSSSSSIVSAHSERSNSEPADEGQLRYWTSDMCSRSPHLFDFVVTVSPPPPPPPPPTHHHHPNVPFPARRRRDRPLHILALPADCAPRAALCAGVPWLPHKFRIQRL
jgi:hypothetical protein